MRIQNILGAVVQATSVSTAFAQQAAALSRKKGIAPDQASPTVDPFAPHLIGRPASELKLVKLNGELNVGKTDLAAFNGHINDISDIDGVLLTSA